MFHTTQAHALWLRVLLVPLMDNLCYIYLASFTSPARPIPRESILSSISITVRACAKDLYKIAIHPIHYQASLTRYLNFKLFNFLQVASVVEATDSVIQHDNSVQAKGMMTCTIWNVNKSLRIQVTTSNCNIQFSHKVFLWLMRRLLHRGLA